MNRKELKNLAKKIANAEYIIQTSSDEKEIKRAQMEIMTLSGHVDSLEDIEIIDELVQEFLQQKI